MNKRIKRNITVEYKNLRFWTTDITMTESAFFRYFKQCASCCLSLHLPHEGCECAHLGNNCDPHTGLCICPPNTVGQRCDKCAPNHWGHDIISGCKVSEPVFYLCVFLCFPCGKLLVFGTKNTVGVF